MNKEIKYAAFKSRVEQSMGADRPLLRRVLTWQLVAGLLTWQWAAGVLTWLGLLTWQWAADVAPRPFPMPRGSGLGFSYCSADAWTSRSWTDKA